MDRLELTPDVKRIILHKISKFHRKSTYINGNMKKNFFKLDMQDIIETEDLNKLNDQQFVNWVEYMGDLSIIRYFSFREISEILATRIANMSFDHLL